MFLTKNLDTGYFFLFSLLSLIMFERVERIIARTPSLMHLRTFRHNFVYNMPGLAAQSVGRLTQDPEVPGSTPGPATYVRFSFRFFKKGSCQLLAKVLVNRLEGLSLPRKSVVRLTDCPDLTIVVYCGRKTTIQQQQQRL